MTTRVLVADDHGIVREGISLILARQPGFEVVGLATNGREAINMALESCPDVALLDISMPDLDGIAAAKAIKQEKPDVGILILTMHDDEELFFAAIQAGASGYLLKGIGSAQLVWALQTVREGGMYFSPQLTRRLVHTYLESKDHSEAENLTKLTPRELEIMRLLAQGLTNRQIAQDLVISPSTVQTHRSHIMEKLGLQNRAQLVQYAVKHKLITL